MRPLRDDDPPGTRVVVQWTTRRRIAGVTSGGRRRQGPHPRPGPTYWVLEEGDSEDDPLPGEPL